MAPVIWLLDRGILEKLSYDRHTIDHYAQAAGHEVIFVDRHDDGTYSEPPGLENKCVVMYGSHQFVKAVQSPKIQPGPLGVNLNTQVTSYMSNLPLDWFMNSDGQFLTWAMFKERVKDFIIYQSPNGVFVRPNSGYKTFAGQRMVSENVDHDISTLEQTSGVMNDTLCFMAPLRNIQGEFRFVIADGKIIAGSEYRWDGKLDIRRDWLPECEELAQKVAEHPWQVDIAYTCDVALTDNGAKLVELNGFSCAGLYACDLEKVVKGISAAALKEYLGDDI